MFEPPVFTNHCGWIEVICGGMFSGKTEELIRRIAQVQNENKTFQLFKPSIDTRYHSTQIVSHNGLYMNAIAVENPQQILELSKDIAVVGIDETQFFDNSIVDVCNELANMGKRLILAGLDMDYLGKPFGSMPNLMAIAEFVDKLHGKCQISGELASYSFRKVALNDEILLGSDQIYEARSRQYFYVNSK